MKDRPQMEKLIAGAIKSTIIAHGPITKEHASSVAKRVIGQVKGYLKDKKQCPMCGEERREN